MGKGEAWEGGQSSFALGTSCLSVCSNAHDWLAHHYLALHIWHCHCVVNVKPTEDTAFSQMVDCNNAADQTAMESEDKVTGADCIA